MAACRETRHKPRTTPRKASDRTAGPNRTTVATATAAHLKSHRSDMIVPGEAGARDWMIWADGYWARVDDRAIVLRSYRASMRWSPAWIVLSSLSSRWELKCRLIPFR